ncbi:hypothetical protein EYC84_008892 [Monilinia fructicola]|nr:hypothetical protein EYC84_008892 [Monilinia fructicola]
MASKSRNLQISKSPNHQITKSPILQPIPSSVLKYIKDVVDWICKESDPSLCVLLFLGVIPQPKKTKATIDFFFYCLLTRKPFKHKDIHDLFKSLLLTISPFSPLENKAVLIVIDGWGVPGENSPKDGDAITNAETPVMDAFANNPDGYTKLEASSLAVGLPEGLMGNSEVGHLNIGAGRVVWQDVVRIDQTIKKGELNKNEIVTQRHFRLLKMAMDASTFVVLISDGGVHAKQDHLYALLKVAKELEVPHVYIHFFADGRDTDPKSGAGYMEALSREDQGDWNR